MKTDLQIGGVCAIVGTILYAISGILHGPLTGANGVEVIYQHVLERPYWSEIHLVSMFAIVLWLGMFVMLACTFTSKKTEAPGFGWFSVAVMAIASSVIFFHFSLDGYVLPLLAENWTATSGAAQQEIVRMGEYVHTVLRMPLFAVEMTFLFGLSFLMIGYLVSRDEKYPQWLGLAGLLISGSILFMGICWFIDVRVLPEILLWIGLMPLQWTWIITLGVFMWRANAREARQ